MENSFITTIPFNLCSKMLVYFLYLNLIYFRTAFSGPVASVLPSVCPNGGHPVPPPCSKHVPYDQTYLINHKPEDQLLLHNSFQSLHNYSKKVSQENSSEIEVEHLKVCLDKILVDGCSTFYPDCNLSRQICIHSSIPMIKQCFDKFPILLHLSKISAENLPKLIANLPNCQNQTGNSVYENEDYYPVDKNTKIPEEDDWDMIDISGPEDGESLPSYFWPIDPEELGNVASASKSCANSDYFIYFNKSKSCAPRCDKPVYFTEKDKKLAFTWLCIWTSLCIVACGFTVLTYFLKCERFSYPERPVIYMSCSCLLYAFGHLLREFTGVAGVGCLEVFVPRDSEYHTYYLRDSVDGQVWCTFTFMMVYYSQMAIHVWWVVLSFSWFLSSTLQWSPEALEDNSVYFHSVAWLAPACKTLLVLATKRFEGDPLTGLCLVGAQTPSNLAIFVIMPISIYLTVGILLSLLGFCSLMRIRNKLRTDPNLKKMDFLIIRIALFAVCYVVPCILYIVVCAIEFRLMPNWTEQVLEREQDQADVINGESIANVYLMLIKHCLTFFIGIATSLWMFNWKTLETWRECFCHSYSPANYSPYNAVKPICPFVHEKQFQQRCDKLDMAVAKNLINLTPTGGNISHGIVINNNNNNNKKQPPSLLMKPEQTLPDSSSASSFNPKITGSRATNTPKKSSQPSGSASHVSKKQTTAKPNEQNGKNNKKETTKDPKTVSTSTTTTAPTNTNNQNTCSDGVNKKAPNDGKLLNPHMPIAVYV